MITDWEIYNGPQVGGIPFIDGLNAWKMLDTK